MVLSFVGRDARLPPPRLRVTASGTATQNVGGETMDGCRALVVAEKYAAEIEAVRDELPDEHVLVRDSEYESWLARRSAVDPDPAIAAEDSAHSHAPDLRREGIRNLR